MRQLFKKTRRIAIFDFSNVVYRATAVGGEFYVNRFCQMMVNYRKKLGSYEFVYAIEGKGTDERRKLYADYKDGRVPSEELIESRNRCRAVVRATDCVIIKANGKLPRIFLYHNADTQAHVIGKIPVKFKVEPFRAQVAFVFLGNL